ncbi:hypothetical protein [Paracoccus sp. (in: a-proteobacteria)]|uniref:hypothetical protein n=1 Tax=Paracoccus sp. TaxID=267 RepID=UPI002B0020D6|nr:hypothetical protein [Paracoccus sp. (in: a-proteobacteria)]
MSKVGKLIIHAYDEKLSISHLEDLRVKMFGTVECERFGNRESDLAAAQTSCLVLDPLGISVLLDDGHSQSPLVIFFSNRFIPSLGHE